MDYLFHYTTVDTLELILKYKTIRFNALYKMDDFQEQYSAHGPALGKHYFISSWTEAEEEIPRMWKEYCKPDPSRGVRLRMPVNPFSVKDNNLRCPVPEERIIAIRNREKIIRAITEHYTETKRSDFNGFDGMQRFQEYKDKLQNEHPDVSRKLIADSEEMQRNITITNNFNVNHLLHQVTYTDDPSKLFPRIYHKYEGQMYGIFQDYCLTKNTSWSWQSEWRYILTFYRARAFRRKNDGKIQWYDVPFDHYDLKLDKDKLSELQITTSPAISDDAVEKLHKILETLLPGTPVSASNLHGLD